MKFALTTLISLISIGALANPLPFYFPGDKKALDSNRCESAKEFIATFDFIRQNPELVDNQEKPSKFPRKWQRAAQAPQSASLESLIH